MEPWRRILQDRTKEVNFGAWNHQHTFKGASGDVTIVNDNVGVQTTIPYFATGWSAPFSVKPRMVRNVQVPN